MEQDVMMPSLGEDAGDECTVSFWHVEVGETIEKDDPLVEMATDKAVFDVPSPFSGTLVKALVSEDDVVKVGQKIGVIDTTE
jgi:pyruvate/2-oxoglutarate dehydrogenase complex dihydrolipoamide acyltransferase (E2) component